jgi:hypothetical protein
MVEIALCLAIIGFALVAIIGVLPTGLEVQRTNREDTIINQEGAFFLEAIRSGSQGLDFLTNYIDELRINSTTNTPYLNGARIIGLLSTPKNAIFIPIGSSQTQLVYSVTAKVRAISGSAAEKGTNIAARDFAFSYLLRSDITPYTNSFPYNIALSSSLYDLRLSLSWPVVQRSAGWAAGPNQQTFRTLVSGRLAISNDILNQRLYFFQPSVYGR